MLEREREREERRERTADGPTDDAFSSGAAHAAAEYYNVVDDLINRTISSNSEAFLQQVEQESGQ
jgi:hypothetical protein